MRGVLKMIVAFALGAMLVTAFATPDRLNFEGAARQQPGFKPQLSIHPVHSPNALLATGFSAKTTFLLRALPPGGAILAAATLVLPFGFSTYRTLRRTHPA